MTKSTQATEEAQVNTDDRAILPIIAGIAALLIGAILLWPSSAKAEGPPPSFEYIVDSFRAQLAVNEPDHARELRRLRRQNRKLRRHVRNYGRWVRSQRRAILVMREQMKLGWQVRNAIALAAEAYGQSEAMLLRKAECESHLWPFARNNSSADSPSGLFQFRPSTFASTPFARFSIWDPYANSLAAGWMHDNGRGGEWACR